ERPAAAARIPRLPPVGFPPPLRGRVRVGGEAHRQSQPLPPTPTLPPKRGGRRSPPLGPPPGGGGKYRTRATVLGVKTSRRAASRRPRGCRPTSTYSG